MITEAPELAIPARTADPEKDAVVEATTERTNAEGTFYQSQVPKAKRRNFFAQTDNTRADAVHKDAETVEYTEEEERIVRRKIDKTVLTLVIFSGNAHILPAFNENFGVTSNNKWTLALSIFYVGYCILEMPANVLQRFIGANRFFFLSQAFWGLASLSFIYSKGVLLGIGEAGYYAGMIYYLSFWYKRNELATRISFCMTGTLPGAISGLIAFGLVRAHTSLLTGWQFLFLIEAIPTLIMAVVILFFLPSFPFSASFLTPRERAIAQARLNRDHKPQSHGGMSGWDGFKAVVCDPNSWLLVIIYASFNIGTSTISYFLPTMINKLGFSSINAQGMTVAPYAAGWFLVIFQAWHSDRTHDRGWHIMASMLTSVVGYVILATCAQKSVGASYFALFLVVAANYSLFPLVMSWAANILSPTSKRGVGTAFVVSISNAISIASPQIYFDAYDDYRIGHGITAACLFVGFASAFVLRTRLVRLNRRNTRKLEELTEDEKSKFAMDSPETVEIWDDDPRYVFMT
ncbi:MFS general substrate transporter [Amylocystis lapponica]|nr:MFS general substrate transporter [Amylocystis lapponica]